MHGLICFLLAHVTGGEAMEFCHVKLSHDFYPSLCIFQSSCWKWSSAEIVWKALCKLHWSFPGPASQLPPILMPCSFSTGIAWRKAMTARDSTYTKKKKLDLNCSWMQNYCTSFAEVHSVPCIWWSIMSFFFFVFVLQVIIVVCWKTLPSIL